MGEESVSLHELLFSCYKESFKITYKYYLENNFINKGHRIINSFTCSWLYIEAAKVQMKKSKWTEEMKLNIQGT